MCDVLRIEQTGAIKGLSWRQRRHRQRRALSFENNRLRRSHASQLRSSAGINHAGIAVGRLAAVTFVIGGVRLALPGPSESSCTAAAECRGCHPQKLLADQAVEEYLDLSSGDAHVGHVPLDEAPQVGLGRRPGNPPTYTSRSLASSRA